MDLLLKKATTECTTMQEDHGKLSEERRKLIEKDKEMNHPTLTLCGEEKGVTMATLLRKNRGGTTSLSLG